MKIPFEIVTESSSSLATPVGRNDDDGSCKRNSGFSFPHYLVFIAALLQICELKKLKVQPQKQTKIVKVGLISKM